MPALDLHTAFANLNALRHRNHHHKQLVFDLAEDGHMREALEELRLLCDLDDQVDDLVRALYVRIPVVPAQDEYVDEGSTPPEKKEKVVPAAPKQVVRLHAR